MNSTRLTHLMNLMSASGLDAFVLNPGPTLTYLIGLSFHLMERPVVLILAPGATPALILPELEALKLDQSLIPLKGFTYGENPVTWGSVFQRACQELKLDGKKVGVEPNRLRFLELRFLEGSATAQFVNGETVVAGMRMVKEPGEVENMRRAVRIAQEALLATIPFIKPGKTEREIASALTAHLLQSGSEPEIPFPPIISGGPNSANPHAVPTERPLQIGDLLVVDWGASYHGYFSDLTRTFAIGKVEDEYRQIAAIVEKANAAGRAASKPGIPAGEVDRVTRKVIVESGYGKFFTHRTGHGLGMEGHEPPYIFAENTLILNEGMTFTVEPGIYLPGRGGVRIEDNVVLTQNGAETLSDMPRQLQTLE
jgi:Xaa-Pro dipeptidase